MPSLAASAVAVAWTLAWPGVTGAIVGARRPPQVDGWLPAATLELTEVDVDEIAAAIERTGAGSGPTRPARGAHQRIAEDRMESRWRRQAIRGRLAVNVFLTGATGYIGSTVAEAVQKSGHQVTGLVSPCQVEDPS